MSSALEQTVPISWLDVQKGLAVGGPRQLMLLPAVPADVMQGVQNVLAADSAS